VETGEIQYLLNDRGGAVFCDHNTGVHRQDHRQDAGPETRYRTGATDDRFLPFEKNINGSADIPAAEIGPDDVSTIVYTSGHSNPKGVLLTHRNI